MGNSSQASAPGQLVTTTPVTSTIGCISLRRPGPIPPSSGVRVLLGDESFYCRFYEVDQLLPELRPSPALYLAYRRGKVSPGQFVQRYQEEIQSDQRRAAALGKLVELVRSGQNLVILDGEIKCPVPPGEVLLQLIAQKISEPRTSLSGQDNADHRST